MASLPATALCTRAQQILLGYQQRSNLDEIFINPKDKDVPKYWTDIDFIVIARDEKVPPYTPTAAATTPVILRFSR